VCPDQSIKDAHRRSSVIRVWPLGKVMPFVNSRIPSRRVLRAFALAIVAVAGVSLFQTSSAMM
jgi:hypothetical protein